MTVLPKVAAVQEVLSHCIPAKILYLLIIDLFWSQAIIQTLGAKDFEGLETGICLTYLLKTDTIRCAM